MDRDYFTIPLREIPKIIPQMTVTGGKIRHLSKEFANEIGAQPVGYQFPQGYSPWEEDDRAFSSMGM